MPREPHIPLFLWIATALLVHLTGGEGVERVSEVLGERMEVQRFADSVRRHVLDSNRTLEVALVDDTGQEVVPEDEVKPPDEPVVDENAPPPKDDPSVKEAKVEKKKDEPPPKDEIKPKIEKMKPPEPEKPKPP